MGETSHLESVYTNLKNVYKEKIPINICDGITNYNDNTNAYHEAGFDAFVTGCSYIWMKEELADKTYHHVNKIYLMRSIYSCFNLDGDDIYIFPNVL